MELPRYPAISQSEGAAGSLEPALDTAVLRDRLHAANLGASQAFDAVARQRGRALQQQEALYTERRAAPTVSGSKRWRAGVLSRKMAEGPRRRPSRKVLRRMVRGPARARTSGAALMHFIFRRLRALSPVGLL